MSSPLTVLYTEVKLQGAHELSIPISGQKGEPLGVMGSNVLAREIDQEAQAGSSTRLKVQAQEDGSSNSGELTTIPGDFRT